MTMCESPEYEYEIEYELTTSREFDTWIDAVFAYSPGEVREVVKALKDKYPGCLITVYRRPLNVKWERGDGEW